MIHYEDLPSSDKKSVAENYQVRLEAVEDLTQRKLFGALDRSTVV